LKQDVRTDGGSFRFLDSALGVDAIHNNIMPIPMEVEPGLDMPLDAVPSRHQQHHAHTYPDGTDSGPRCSVEDYG